jgi:ABC-type multidrug transport system ATPase subunit
VLDEPFNGLDPLVLDDLQNILHEEHHRGATLLISTHTMSAIEQLATHVAVLLYGQLISFGTIETLREEHNGENSLEAIYQEIARTRRNAVREEAFV